MLTLAGLCSVSIEQMLSQKEIDSLPVKRIKLEVGEEKQTYVFDPQVLTYYQFLGQLTDTQREVCTLQQAKYYYDTEKIQTFDNWPVLMNRMKPKVWFSYIDANYLIYRTNPYSPVYIATFAKYGYELDFWKLGEYLDGKDGVTIFRDKSDINGPTEDKRVATYIYYPQRTFLYHEMTERGDTYRVRHYTTDIDLNAIDMIAISNRIYVISPERIFVFHVNEDKIKKELELADFNEINKYKLLGLTQGKVFFFVQKVTGKNTYELYANDNFTTAQTGMSYLEDTEIHILLGGHQYVFQTISIEGRIRYWYIKNPTATRFFSLEFTEIQGITEKYTSIVYLNDRIHFFSPNTLSHSMYLIGTDQGIVKFPTSKPILGILYDYFDQPMENDRFLLVDDKVTYTTEEREIPDDKATSGSHSKKVKVVVSKREGRVSVVPIKIAPPQVTCSAGPKTLEYNLKLYIITRAKRYYVNIHVLKKGVHAVSKSRFVYKMWALVLGIAVTLITYCCWVYQKVNTEYIRVKLCMGNLESVGDDTHGFANHNIAEHSEDEDDMALHVQAGELNEHTITL